MVRYKNLSGNSGVYAYEIGVDNINVQFTDGSIYVYTNSSTGHSNLQRMKALAQSGRGLNSFISTTIRKNYFARLR